MASSSPGDDRLIGRVIADRYQIMEVLGEGGMGRVYLAEHVRMGRKSAVKVLSPNMALSADAITRFNREAANAARINHPNVAQIYDFGETSDGVLYLAMEFVEGETLRTLIESSGPVAPARAAALAKQIADALAAAHHLGIVHRDLKPDNIMVARHHDGSDWVKVVDFGIAKTVQGSGDPGAGSQTLTTAGVSLGTPEYMSPEQLAGERLDSRTDLYSLGLVLFNMLTADLPYPKLTSRETLVRRLTSKPHTLADVKPEVVWPPALQAALDRALAPEAADRYESVTDFGNDVVLAVAGFDPTTTLRVPQKAARLSGPTVRIEAPPARKRVPAWRAPLIAAAVVLGAVGAADAAYVAYRSPAKPPMQAAASPVVVPQATTAPAPVVPAPSPKPTQATLVAHKTAHSELRANSDSGAARSPSANAGDADRIRLLAEEIRGHAMRANQFMGQGDVPHARAEMRDMSAETQTFRLLFPAAADSIHLPQLMRAAGARIFQTCQAALADSGIRFPRNFTCQQLIPNGNRARGIGGGQLGRRPF